MKTRTITLILLTATAAQAVPSFSNAVGGSNVAYGPSSISWGVPYAQPYQSGLAWTEAAYTPSPAPFILGELTHSNYPQAVGTSISAVDLNTHGLTFTLLVNETPNTGGPVDDIISFPAVMPQASFTVLGFGPTPDNILPSYSSPENGSSSTFLWVSKPIPAPGAVILCGIGALLVGRKRLAWRRII